MILSSETPSTPNTLSEKNKPHQIHLEIINYLSELSGDLHSEIKGFVARFLYFINEYTNSTTGFETIMLSEGVKGPGGLIGVFALDSKFPETDEKTNEKNEKPKYFIDPRIDKFLQEALKLIQKEYRKVSYPPIDSKKHLISYPERKLEDPMVRIIIDTGFIDLPLTEAIRLSEEQFYTFDNEYQVTGLCKLITEGKNAVPGAVNAAQLHSVAQWNSQSQKMAEPPLIAISLKSSNDRQQHFEWLRDPRLLMHLQIITNHFNQVKKIHQEFAHVPIYGLEMLHDLAAKIFGNLDDVSTEESPAITFDTQSARMQDEFAPVFPDDNPALLELAKAIDVFEVDVEMHIPKDILSLLLKNSKMYGKGIGLWTLSALLTSGQAAFFPVNQKNEDNLQIALGLGGSKLLKRLRSLAVNIRDFNDLLHMDQEVWKEIYNFHDWWNEKKLADSLNNEIARAEQGFGTPNALAQATGPRLRRISEKAFGIFFPKLVIMLKSRWQISSLGKNSEKIKNKVESTAFWTAGSENTSTAIGILENIVTGRFFAKDALIWSEAIVRIMRSKREITYELLKGLNDTEAKEWQSLQVDKKTVNEVRNWLTDVTRDGVEKAKSLHLNGQVLPAMEYLREIGDSVHTRDKILQFSKVLTVILNKAIKNSPSTNFQDTLKNEFIFLAKQKMTWFLIHALELSLIAGAKNGVFAPIDEIPIDRQFFGADPETHEGSQQLQLIQELMKYIKEEELKIITN
jgi:hypothetical protein